MYTKQKVIFGRCVCRHLDIWVNVHVFRNPLTGFWSLWFVPSCHRPFILHKNLFRLNQKPNNLR